MVDISSIKSINSETFGEFAQKIEVAKENFIPMLPFVKIPVHDFDRYKDYNEKGIFLIDYIEDEYCLYHLYQINSDDDTLRPTLILPSNWDKRFEIIEKSIPNIKEWFLKENNTKKFIVQSLEYGEIEYYPTLSHYLIPTFIRNGFEPKYRMYMKREENLPFNKSEKLDKGLLMVDYSSEILNKVIDFYYNNESIQKYRYFTNCTYEELLQLLKDDFTINNSKFITDENGNVISGIIVTEDLGKIWIDNFSVSPEYDGSNVGYYILGEVIKNLAKTCPDETIYIYLNRDCRDAVLACEKYGFVPFEYWTDMIFERL